VYAVLELTLRELADAIDGDEHDEHLDAAA